MVLITTAVNHNTVFVCHVLLFECYLALVTITEATQRSLVGVANKGFQKS